MKKETFFNPFFCGNNPLSGNFFGVMESCHLMTMTLLKALARWDNAWQCNKCVFGNRINPGYHFVNNCNIGFQPSPWYKTFMAVNVNVFLGPNRIL